MATRNQRGFYLRKGIETHKSALGADVASKSLLAAFLDRSGEGGNSLAYNPYYFDHRDLAGLAERSQPRPTQFHDITAPATFDALPTVQCPDALMLDHIAWYRHRADKPTASSVVGVIHVLCQNTAIDALRRLVRAPIHPWDAIVCPSNAVRDAVRSLLESEQAYVVQELGARNLRLPELPVIPLGVETQRYAITTEQRRAARTQLALAANEVAILFVGRLDPAQKAHPFTLLRALEVLAQQTQVPFRLVIAGWFRTDELRQEFYQLQQILAPSIRVTELNGRQRKAIDLAWQSADIFCSLADNIQETFGLTPLEAKAAGLPVVVSDWDGYRDSVRHGIDGYRVPTYAPSPTAGRALLATYDETYRNRELAYETYAGSLSQMVGVDMEVLLQSLGQLIVNPDQRRSMGTAGQADAVQHYDWQQIMAAYESTWRELDARRRDAQRPARVQLPYHIGLGRPYPFALFSECPSTSVGEYDRVAATSALHEAALETWLHQPLVQPIRSYLEDQLGLHEVVRDLLAQPDRALADWVRDRSTPPGADLYPVLAWLYKYGFVVLYNDAETRASS